MFKFDSFKSSAVAVLFSIILTVTAVGAAVGPSQVAVAAPAASAQA